MNIDIHISMNCVMTPHGPIALEQQQTTCINTLRFYVSVCVCVSDGSGMFVGRD